MKQITKTLDISSETPIAIDDIVMIMEDTAGENFNNHTGGKMKILKRRFERFWQESRVARQLEIKASM